ncbi:hypothetical protein BDK51DRAFT_34346 [Blyttiomyces helicus]|uniref:Uncharacterized protein n=1 Tax=Blyttiomyces helicus TaxID=388810 RepID=A0A4P9WNX2_9FUNG|nr:hypothetical protein BDK51DRAFT_34346 [Blyttiomyces helicus]|eukprot:RKO94839.1 hypothetical protein BDK51DRAFT_34346 [Blyttiomyces helicus]
MSDPVVLECNGIILRKTTFEIVARGMDNICQIDIDQAMSYLDGADAYSFEEAEDGTVSRVSYIDDEWVVSTNRCIDATRARWSSTKSFYRLLCETVKEAPLTLFERDLAKDETHSFILLHPQNQHVIHHRNPELVYVGSRHIGTFIETSSSPRHVYEGSRHIRTSSSKPLLSWSKLPHSMSAEECRIKHRNPEMQLRRGVIFTKEATSDSPSVRWKVDYEWFKNASSLRKNLPTMHLSYLACSIEERKVFRSYFGSDGVFDMIDWLLISLRKYTMDVYRDTYILKKYTLPRNHPMRGFLYRFHGMYLDNREPIRIQHVEAFIQKESVYVLDSILRFLSNFEQFNNRQIMNHYVDVEMEDVKRTVNRDHSSRKNAKGGRRAPKNSQKRREPLNDFSPTTDAYETHFPTLCGI